MSKKITKEEFKQKIFNYETNHSWAIQGTLPCIVDFYADWCGPCRVVGPIIDEIAKEYADRLDVYKVNIDEEQEIASALGIQVIPTLFFIPLKGELRKEVGALSKQQIVQKISEIFGID